jgi:hypothetical protein
MERTLFSDFSLLCPSLEFFNRIGRKPTSASATTLVSKGGLQTFAEVCTNVCCAGLRCNRKDGPGQAIFNKAAFLFHRYYQSCAICLNLYNLDIGKDAEK